MPVRQQQLARTALVAALATGLAACDDLVGTAPTVEWTSSLQRVSTGNVSVDPPPTSVSLNGRRIRLEGVAVAPSSCEDVRLKAQTSGQVIELYVRIVNLGGACRPIIREFAYTVEAVHPPGEYRVIARYEHVPGGGGWPNGVTADTIVVIE